MKNTKKTYVVCMDSSFIRDAQMFQPNDLGDEEFFEADIHDVKHEQYWRNCEPTHFVAIVNASSEEDACEIAGIRHRYDPRTLYAFEAKPTEMGVAS